MTNVNNNHRTSTASVREHSSETKGALKTTEFWVFLVVSIGILIASAVVDGGEDGQGGFGAAQAWSSVALVTVGYLLSRGLAKAGSRSTSSNHDVQH